MEECNNKFSFPLQIKKRCGLNDIYPSRINIVEYNKKYYDAYALELFIGQYEDIIRKTIKSKTDELKEYIGYYSDNSNGKLLSITNFTGYNYYYEIIGTNIFDYYMNQCIIANNLFDSINLSIINITGDSVFNIPAIRIKDDDYFSLFAINELKKSMEIVSPYLINNIKNVLIDGIDYQTEIYGNNITKYVNWYYSLYTKFEKGLVNVIGFFISEKNANEEYLLNNFNTIMSNNANFDNIVRDDFRKQLEIVSSAYKEYNEFKDYYSINFYQGTLDIISLDGFIEPYTDYIVNYFTNVFEALDNANKYNIQDYTSNDSKIVNAAKTAIKILPGFNFVAGVFIDFLALKTQKLLYRDELEKKIYDSMIKNQNIKKEIINNPFNYIYDKLKIGSILYVDNYIVGFSTYQHYGVYIGDGKVIHFAPMEGKEISAENGIIHETTLDKFLDGRALRIDANIEKKFSDNEIVQRARSRLGEKGYSLLTNNCEHFARWCVTGDNVSYQIVNLPSKINNASLTIQESINTVSKYIDFINWLF
jgi:hypothetical protein